MVSREWIWEFDHWPFCDLGSNPVFNPQVQSFIYKCIVWRPKTSGYVSYETTWTHSLFGKVLNRTNEHGVSDDLGKAVAISAAVDRVDRAGVTASDFPLHFLGGGEHDGHLIQEGLPGDVPGGIGATGKVVDQDEGALVEVQAQQDVILMAVFILH